MLQSMVERFPPCHHPTSNSNRDTARDPIVKPAVPQRVLNPASRVMSEFLHDCDEVMMRNIHTE